MSQMYLYSFNTSLLWQGLQVYPYGQMDTLAQTGSMGKICGLEILRQEEIGTGQNRISGDLSSELKFQIRKRF